LTRWLLHGVSIHLDRRQLDVSGIGGCAVTSKTSIDRRRLGQGLIAAAATAPFAAKARLAFAGGTAAASADPWVELDAMTKAAEALGLSAPQMSLGPMTATSDYNDIAPAIIDFIDSVEKSAPSARGIAPDSVQNILQQATALLRELREAERSPREPEEGEETDGAPQFSGPAIVAPDITEISANYRELFASCKIRDDRRGEITDYVNKMLEETRRKNYEQVADQTCIPWYFVGAIHALEASFDFTAHLHNGDSLRKRTWQVPANRPKTWLPPSDWTSSAIDALSMKGYDKETKWGLPETLYRWERYNGWRSRLLYNINTPYLWSYSNHYSKGKFVRDNVWDVNAVSKQPGAAVLLRAMVDMGAVPAPA
jgi:lysozyme family protein